MYTVKLFTKWNKDYAIPVESIALAYLLADMAEHSNIRCEVWDGNERVDYDDAMRKWQVWTEGYSVSGDPEHPADYWGDFDGETFADACAAAVATLPEASRSTFNRERLTFWGCRFFDNETDARMSFG